MTNQDGRNALGWLDDEARVWAERGLARRLEAVEPEAGVLDFRSNDYLGLANDPRVREAAADAASRFGWGAGASPLVSGWRAPHEDLVRALARFEGADAAVLFPTGYSANVGTISALVSAGDAVYLDRLNHASLIDGAKLSGAKLRVFPHNDADRLNRILRQDRGRFRRHLIAVDSVFSMDGDLAPLEKLADIADDHKAMLLADEAHGTGVWGSDGRGAASALGAADRIDVKIGTLSKALGSIGGFVAGSQRLADWLTNRARSLMFSTSLPPAAAAAALRALEIVESEPWRREKVHALGGLLRNLLRDRGCGYAILSETGPIVPIRIGDPRAAVALSQALRRRGLLAPAIRPPAVPRDSSRLRISLSAAHEESDIHRLADALIEEERS